MKKAFVVVVPALALLAILGPTTADAQTVQQVPQVTQGGVVLKMINSRVHGTVDISKAKAGDFAGMTCDKLTVAATSVAMKTCNPPPGQLCGSTPKWVHSTTTSGSGTSCSFSVPVPSGKEFGLSVSTGFVIPNCGGGYTRVDLKSGPGTGQMKLDVGQNKQVDLVVDKFDPECLH